MLMGSRWRYVAVAAVVSLAAAACGSSSHSSTGATTGGSSASTAATGSAGATGSPYQIGFITSNTGGASSSYAGSVRGADARVDALNAGWGHQRSSGEAGRL